MSDLRIGDRTDVIVRATAVIAALAANFEPRFDFIAVTGDIKDRTANAQPAYEKAGTFLHRLAVSLLRESDPGRILIVPGDHDWSKGSGFLHYNRFVEQWYSQSQLAHCLKSATDEDGASVAYLIDHRADDVVFLLLNSYWQQNPKNDRLGSGKVGESQRQAFERQLDSLFTDSNACPPKLALMHQHLIQASNFPEYTPHTVFSQDYPETLEWLFRQQTVITFHGPPLSYTLLRTEDVNTAQAELSTGTELITMGAGACRAGDGRQEDRNQFQAITVNLKPQRFLESTVQKRSYNWDGATWLRSPLLFTSHQTFSAFQKDLVKAEQFTCDQIHENTPHPLRSESADDWFWNHYNKVWSEHNPQAPNGESLLKRKEDFLTNLVKELREYNSKRSIFELLPFQLDAVYTYAAIFFGNKEIEEAARREFSSTPWQSWLRFNDIVEYARWTHLDWANWIIADCIRAWVVERRPQKIGIVDLGYGLLRTIDSIGRNLPDAPSGQRYLGIDVSKEQKQSATQMLAQGTNQSRFFSNDKTRKFEHINEYFVESSGREFWLPDNRYLPELAKGGFNVFVCVYAMHHCSNSFRVRKSLIDGSFFRFIAHRTQSGKQHLSENLGPRIMERLDSNQRESFLNDLLMLSQDPRHVLNSSGAGKAGTDWAQTAINRVIERAFPDTQLDIYKAVFDTMQDGGLLCIADPNGMSKTFNRQQIFNNVAIAIAHFSDWVDAASMIYKAGFRKIRVFRQIRLNSLQVRRVEVPEDSINAILADSGNPETAKVARQRSFGENIMPEEFEQFKSDLQLKAENVSPLEILDQHMGYILIAEKPKAA